MTFKEFLLHQLREMKREMTTAIGGLSHEDLTSHEPCQHWPIAWNVQHCCAHVDNTLHRKMKEAPLLDHEEMFRTWPLIEPKPGDPYPPLPELMSRWSAVMGAVVKEFEVQPDDSIPEEPKEGGESLAETCLRVINHINSHLRIIWCILGERRTDDKWPVQQTWLA